MKSKTKNEMWPIFYKNKWWNKWECSNIFLSYYTCKMALRETDCAVYAIEGIWIYPDGETNHDESND